MATLSPLQLACADAAARCPAEHFSTADGASCVSRVVEVAAGAHHTCARHRDGRISCWGLGEAINGSGGAVVRPAFIAGIQAARAVAAGSYQTCAVTGDSRQVQCWGSQSFTVVDAAGLPLGGAAAITVADGFGCAATDEAVFCWGDNSRGQLARPLDVGTSAVAVAALPGRQACLGAGTSVVTVDGQGRLCAWGDNSTQVISDAAEVGLYTVPVCADVEGGVAAIAVGSVHACARRSDGAVSCWGERYYGQLGTGGTDADTADVPPFGSRAVLATPARAVVAGASHTCVLLADGGVACFGLNSNGQVGPNAGGPGVTVNEVRIPVAVSQLSDLVVGVGSGSTAQHTCAVLAAGGVACWGKNDTGQLGGTVSGRDETRFSARPIAVDWP